MSNLRELTKDKHTAAEKTKFMKAVFKNSMPISVWADWTYQKSLFYKAIESCAESLGLLKGIEDIKRADLLLSDFNAMLGNNVLHAYKPTTTDYYKYIMSVADDKERVLAHLYVWHMGDLHGGQMIKKMISGSHTSLEFVRRDELIIAIRSKLKDSLAAEANVAFDWAMRIMSEYDNELGI